MRKATTTIALGGAMALAAAFGPQALADSGYGGPYGFGSVATAQDIGAIDIDAMPDGRGLPPGNGTYAEGEQVYNTKCAACHGANLEGIGATGGAALIGGRGSLDSGKPKKTVESYWPYASIVFDYVKRAMPFNAPGSLSDDEVYAVSAYVLGRAGIIGQNEAMNSNTLAAVKMPNADGFIADPRPDIFNYD